MAQDKSAVTKILDQAKSKGRAALTAPEARALCEAYGIPLPREELARNAAEAGALAARIGFPVVMKIVSPQILHKTEAGGVVVGVKSTQEASQAYDAIIANARNYDGNAEVLGVQIQRMLHGGQEVIIGAVTDPAFGKLVAFGLGGVLVEVLKDVTFRLAPASQQDAFSMLDSIAAAEILRGVRGAPPIDRAALADMIERVSTLVADFPEIAELDLNPVFATERGATAADVRVVLNFNPPPARYRPDPDRIVAQMNRIMRPDAVAVIGASAENGKIGNSVMKNLINGGYQGAIYPIHPSAESILGRKAFKSVKAVKHETSSRMRIPVTGHNRLDVPEELLATQARLERTPDVVGRPSPVVTGIGQLREQGVELSHPPLKRTTQLTRPRLRGTSRAVRSPSREAEAALQARPGGH